MMVSCKQNHSFLNRMTPQLKKTKNNVTFFFFKRTPCSGFNSFSLSPCVATGNVISATNGKSTNHKTSEKKGEQKATCLNQTERYYQRWHRFRRSIAQGRMLPPTPCL